jgi:histidine triad (HIT) family protein
MVAQPQLCGILNDIMDTIFSKIIAREIPAPIVYEDEVVLAFLDINPVNFGHTLVIPKKHFTNIFDGDSDILAHMMKVAQKIARALKQAGLAEGVNLVMNNGEAASQEIWHAHIHVIPRLTNDHSFTTPKHTPCAEEDFLKIKGQITAAI